MTDGVETAMLDEGPDDGPVRLRRLSAHVALVTIDRPQARNAVDGEVAKGLDRAVRQTEQDPDIWAVILTGAGDQAFCAGADLKAVAAGQVDSLFTAEGGFAGFVHHSLRTKPWIAAVNGFALAGGTEIALACDFVIASQTAVFGLPEVKRGLIAAAGGVYRLVRALPRALALELIATGAPLDAERAYVHGLVNRVVAQDALMAEALRFAEAICANAPIAVRESLGIARHAHGLPDAALRQLSEQAAQRIRLTEDFQEGPRAFIEKRQPRWRGR